jgi:hypothetical protein
MVSFMGSGDGPKNGPKRAIFIINCVLRHGTPLDTFSDLSKTGMYHLKIFGNSDYMKLNEWMIYNNELKRCRRKWMWPNLKRTKEFLWGE